MPVTVQGTSKSYSTASPRTNFMRAGGARPTGQDSKGVPQPIKGEKSVAPVLKTKGYSADTHTTTVISQRKPTNAAT